MQIGADNCSTSIKELSQEEKRCHLVKHC